ncbi:DUF3784 domain-containing protein [Blautia obeum]|nr:DUF3784 domain-containing protein [Blautia obeum]MCQ4791455.1 DUF3784 domain-containing protein [Blautia obeum]
MWFYKSEGKATKFLSGYNMKSADERKKYDENGGHITDVDGNIKAFPNY